MKIVYYFRNYNSMMFQWQRRHIFDEMALHDCHFVAVSPTDYKSVEQANEQLIQIIRQNKADIFMTSFSTDVLFLETLAEIKRLGVRTLLFCPDNLVVPFNHEKIAKYFDLVWLTSGETKYLFDRWGASSIMLPYAANPNLFNNSINKIDIERLAFVGTPHGSRVERIAMLLDAGIPMTVFSNRSDTDNSKFKASLNDYLSVSTAYLRFPIGRKLLLASIIDKLGKHEIDSNHPHLQLEQPVPIEKLGEVNSKFALTLSFTEANSTGVLKKPVPIVNLRNFEIPMSGGLQITMYSDEIASYFEDGSEIILAHSKEELIDKAKFYLSDKKQDIRFRMKVSARERAINEHTWFCRFHKIFEYFNLTNFR